MNLIDQLRRSIVVAAVATTVVGGLVGTAQADNTPKMIPLTVSAASATTTAHAPTPAGALVAAVTAPTAPRSVTAAAGNARVKLAWLAPSSNGGATINKYRVQRARAGGRWKTIAYPTTRRYAATGLTNGVRYYFRVAAHNPAGWSKPSTAVKAVPRTKPTAPRSPTATPGNGTVKLAWLAPASSGGATINQYRVQRARAGGPWKSIAYPTTRYYSATGLTNGTRYYFRVAAHNTAGWGPSSTVVTTVPRTVPTAPQSPTATRGLHSVYLTWQKPASSRGAAIDKYIIEHHTSAENEWKVLDETKASVLSYQATGLTQVGDQHYFRIRAHNEAGLGAGSTVVDAFAVTAPSPPSNLKATLNNGTIDLKWTAPYDGGTPINKYIVQQAINQQEKFATIDYSTTTSYHATVQPGRTYNFQILAQNDAGTSAPSFIVSVTIPPTVPDAPSFCVAYQLGGNGSDTMRIEWGPPTSSGGAPILFYDVVVHDEYDPQAVFKTSVWHPTITYDEVLPVGHFYGVAIKAYNKVGPGPSCFLSSLYMFP